MANLTTCYRGGNKEMKPGFRLSFIYEADFVEEFKEAIPHTAREWDPSSKEWWAAVECDAALQKLFSNFYALIHQQGSLF